MAIELKMPALSPTMEKGTLAKWLVSEGDRIKPGDLLAEIETDKATMEFEAIDEGVVAQLVVGAGTDDIAVGTIIALLTSEGETSVADALAATITEPAPADVQTVLEKAAPATLGPAGPAEASSTAPLAVDLPGKLPARRAVVDGAKISPLAQRIAEAKDIDVSKITGSGPHGRIVRADLGIEPITARTLREAAPASAPAVSITAPPPAGVPVETVKLTGMRKTIARRLTESKQTVPHFYLTARCNLDSLLALRAELNAGLATHGIKLSVNDFLIKAMARALTEVPDANVQFGGDELHRFLRVDISMAVAIDGGLITPVIRDAGALSLSAISQTSKTLAVKAREGTLLPEDYQGGTASISNLGMFGIDEMFPVINPPQALILGVGAGIEQPWGVDGQIKLATIFCATASFDHRAIDGAVAARFMAALRSLIETPLTIVS